MGAGGSVNSDKVCDQDALVVIPHFWKNGNSTQEYELKLKGQIVPVPVLFNLEKKNEPAKRSICHKLTELIWLLARENLRAGKFEEYAAISTQTQRKYAEEEEKYYGKLAEVLKYGLKENSKAVETEDIPPGKMNMFTPVAAKYLYNRLHVAFYVPDTEESKEFKSFLAFVYTEAGEQGAEKWRDSVRLSPVPGGKYTEGDVVLSFKQQAFPWININLSGNEQKGWTALIRETVSLSSQKAKENVSRLAQHMKRRWGRYLFGAAVLGGLGLLGYKYLQQKNKEQEFQPEEMSLGESDEPNLESSDIPASPSETAEQPQSLGSEEDVLASNE